MSIFLDVKFTSQEGLFIATNNAEIKGIELFLSKKILFEHKKIIKII